MKVGWITGCLISLLIKSATAEQSISFLWQPQYNYYSSDTLFYVPNAFIKKPEIISQKTIELRGNQYHKFVEGFFFLSLDNQRDDTGSVETDIKMNELYLTKSISNWEFTLGRQISSWGVGYGFRPLDVIQQYDRQTTNQRSVIGKNRIALDYYFGMSSWSLVWVDPMKSGGKDNRNMASIVSKYSTSRDNYDLHAVARYNKKNKLQLGLGGVFITTDALSLHGSILVSQAYQKQINTLAGQSRVLLSEKNPYQTVDYYRGFQALLGFSWSSFSKHNIIIEYWYDDMAYSHQEWKNLFQLAKQQQNLLDQAIFSSSLVHGNIAWTATATQAQSLAPHNLMVLWRYDAEYWKPAINVLFSPVDKSYMTTLSTLRSTRLFKFEAGVRAFKGSNNSIYGGLIITSHVFMTLSSEY